MQPVVMPPMRGYEPYPFEPGDAPMVPVPGQPRVLSGMGSSEPGPLLPKWAIPVALGALALGGLAIWYHLSVVKKLKGHSEDPESDDEGEAEVEFDEAEQAPRAPRSKTAKRNPKSVKAAFAKAEKKAKKTTAAWLSPKKAKSATKRPADHSEKLASTPAPKRRKKSPKASPIALLSQGSGSTQAESSASSED